MAAIIGKKLGMTQLFEENGTVVPVTVIEAGPCPVTAIRSSERDGYDALQLAFGETREKRLTKAELGHLGKAGAPPMKTLVEFRGEAGEHQIGDSVTVEVFEPGQKVKVSGISRGKGFQGTIRRHNFSRGPASHGSHNVRAPGSIGASATPSRVFKGMRLPGQMGNKRITQRALEVVRVDAAENLLFVRGAVPGPQGGTVEVRTDARYKAAVLGKQSKADLPDAVFGEGFHQSLVHETARAELAARRRGTASTLTRGEVSMTTAKAFRQKGTGRARAGALSTPQRTGGGIAFGPKPRHYTVKVNRKARRRALRSALSAHAERGSVALVETAAFKEPSTKQAATALEGWARPALVLLGQDETAAAKSFRNLERVTVRLAGQAGVADIAAATSLILSADALEALVEMAKPASRERSAGRAKEGQA